MIVREKIHTQRNHFHKFWYKNDQKKMTGRKYSIYPDGERCAVFLVSKNCGVSLIFTSAFWFYTKTNWILNPNFDQNLKSSTKVRFQPSDWVRHNPVNKCDTASHQISSEILAPYHNVFLAWVHRVIYIRDNVLTWRRLQINIIFTYNSSTITIRIIIFIITRFNEMLMLLINKELIIIFVQNYL